MEFGVDSQGGKKGFTFAESILFLPLTTKTSPQAEGDVWILLWKKEEKILSVEKKIIMDFWLVDLYKHNLSL